MSTKEKIGICQIESFGELFKLTFKDKVEYVNSYFEYHREDGPAVEEADGTKYWYKKSLLHREDGPAIEHSSGEKEYYNNGHRYY